MGDCRSGNRLSNFDSNNRLSRFNISPSALHGKSKPEIPLLFPEGTKMSFLGLGLKETLVFFLVKITEKSYLRGGGVSVSVLCAKSDLLCSVSCDKLCPF